MTCDRRGFHDREAALRIGRLVQTIMDTLPRARIFFCVSPSPEPRGLSPTMPAEASTHVVQPERCRCLGTRKRRCRNIRLAREEIPWIRLPLSSKLDRALREELGKIGDDASVGFCRVLTLGSHRRRLLLYSAIWPHTCGDGISNVRRRCCEMPRATTARAVLPPGAIWSRSHGSPSASDPKRKEHQRGSRVIPSFSNATSNSLIVLPPSSCPSTV